MTESDTPDAPAVSPDPLDAARHIAVQAASLAELARGAGLDVVARLLNIVRIEAEIKVSEIQFRAPSGAAGNKG